MKRRTFTLIAVFLVCGVTAQSNRAGQYNRVLSIGDASPQWKGLEGIDGTKHSLSDLSDRKVIVVHFTCNDCPYAR